MLEKKDVAALLIGCPDVVNHLSLLIINPTEVRLVWIFLHVVLSPYILQTKANGGYFTFLIDSLNRKPCASPCAPPALPKYLYCFSRF